MRLCKVEMAAYYKPNGRAEPQTQGSRCFPFLSHSEASSPLASALGDVSDLAESLKDETLTTQTSNIHTTLWVSVQRSFNSRYAWRLHNLKLEHRLISWQFPVHLPPRLYRL